ncbi:MAG TPA: adenylate/guanylate cyclase domain-containing protein [Pseudolabrys sp.]|nr:adenylate/guanylate cyclase domain-containing protein [Pseudolabrys sp.]
MALNLRAFNSKTWRAALVAVVALSFVTTIRALDPTPIAQLRERTFDTYQRLRPRPVGDYPVRIVDIDEASLAAIGQWPWSRDVVAKLVTRLTELGAAVIAFDVTFAEPDRTSPKNLARALPPGEEGARMAALLAAMPDYDSVFASAISHAPVVLGFAGAAANDRRPAAKSGFALAGADAADVGFHFSGTATNLPAFDAAASGVGGLNISSHDKSGIVRRVPVVFTDGSKLYPSLVVEALRVAQQQKGVILRGSRASGEIGGSGHALVDMRIGDFTVPLTGDGEIWVYFNRDRPDRYVSAKDVLDPAKAAAIKERIEGHIIYVGTSAAGLLDTWPTPLNEFVPGVSVHAQATEQILGQTFLYRPDWTPGAELLTIILVGVLLTVLLLRLGARYASPVFIAVLVLGFGGSWLAFTNFGLLLDPVYPALASTLTYFAVVGVLYVATDQEKKFVRQAFGQYVAPELLAKLEDAPEMMRLGGETRILTLMFMDVRGFTPISEGLTAEELVEFINRLLSPLTDTIQHELGTIDKYMGDAIMAFWNAPLDIPDHPLRACRAALKMRSVVEELNASDAFGFRARGKGDRPVKIGMGINTGEACVGNMGSERRFNYSAMGDVVNTTSRIESSCKEVGFDIVLSADTARLVPQYALLEAGDFDLKGKSAQAKLFALLGDESFADSAAFKELARHHAELLAALAAGRLSEATERLAQCRALGGALTGGFYDRYQERLDETADDAPPVRAAE